jgi:hypothetical protein
VFITAGFTVGELKPLSIDALSGSEGSREQLDADTFETGRTQALNATTFVGVAHNRLAGRG